MICLFLSYLLPISNLWLREAHTSVSMECIAEFVRIARAMRDQLRQG